MKATAAASFAPGFPASGSTLDALNLPLMVARNTESMATAYTVTVDYRPKQAQACNRGLHRCRGIVEGATLVELRGRSGDRWRAPKLALRRVKVDVVQNGAPGLHCGGSSRGRNCSRK